LFLDGLVQTTERDEFFYHEMLVEPALCTCPRPDRVLIIGGGDGGALRQVLKHPVKKAWLVEIDEEVIKACGQYFPWLEAGLSDPRAELAIADGFDFIQKPGKNLMSFWLIPLIRSDLQLFCMPGIFI